MYAFISMTAELILKIDNDNMRMKTTVIKQLI